MVHYGELKRAILWYQKAPTRGKKKIYLYGRYYAVSIRKEKIHIHKLLMCYWFQMRHLPKSWCVHHKDGDFKNNLFPNLWLIPKSAHTSFHLRGRKQSPEFVKRRIAASVKKRWPNHIHEESCRAET